MSFLPSVVALGLAALAALHLARTRASPPERSAERVAAARALAVAVAAQGIHFAEETATGFYERFPALFGLPALPLSFFVAFNVAWLAIWVASGPGLRAARVGAFFAAWFLAIAGTLNGVAHPLFAVVAGGYFPGLATAPFVAAAGVWLGFRLRDATRPVAPTPSASAHA